MNRKTIVILAILSLTVTAQAKNVSAALTLSYLAHADSGFREVYGPGGLMPGLRLEAGLWKDLSLYASCGFFARTGATPVLEQEAKTTQRYISAGASWKSRLSEKMAWNLYAGMLFVIYREEALGETISDNALGLEIGAGLRYRLGARLFLCPFVSYLLAGDTVEESKIKLGGARAGIGLGVTF
jgi:hypothetical protein